MKNKKNMNNLINTKDNYVATEIVTNQHLTGNEEGKESNEDKEETSLSEEEENSEEQYPCDFCHMSLAEMKRCSICLEKCKICTRNCCGMCLLCFCDTCNADMCHECPVRLFGPPLCDSCAIAKAERHGFSLSRFI